MLARALLCCTRTETQVHTGSGQQGGLLAGRAGGPTRKLPMTCDRLGPGRSEGPLPPSQAEVGSFPHPRSFHHLIFLVVPSCLTKNSPRHRQSRDSVVPSKIPPNWQATQRASAGGICTLVSFWASCDLVMRLPRAGVTSRPAKRRPERHNGSPGRQRIGRSPSVQVQNATPLHLVLVWLVWSGPANWDTARC